MTFLLEMVNLLLNGTEGHDVICHIKNYYGTHFSFEKNVSNVRRLFLKHEKRHANFEEDIKTLQTNLYEHDVVKFQQFLNCSLEQQYDIIKRKVELFANDALNSQLQNIRLLPDNMISFQIGKTDHIISKQKKTESLLKRNKRKIVVENASDMLKTYMDILKNGSSSNIKEIIALLLVSGRRECEILNGKSTFDKVDGFPYHSYFRGVLKKKGFEDNQILIPLLCPFELFNDAFQRMRKSQQKDILNMTNKQISNRYCSQLNKAQKKWFPMLTKPHDLRGVYAKFVDNLFSHNVSFPMVCMYSLGHDVLQDSLYYMMFDIGDDFIANYGPLFADSNRAQYD